jgi:hypothetical protein
MLRYLPLLVLGLVLVACTPALYPVREITVSQRFGLVVPGASSWRLTRRARWR